MREKNAFIGAVAGTAVKKAVPKVLKNVGKASIPVAKAGKGAVGKVGKAKVGPISSIDALFVGGAGGSGMYKGMNLSGAKAAEEKVASVQEGVKKLWDVLGKASTGTSKYTGKTLEGTGKFLQGPKGKYIPPAAIAGALAYPGTSKYIKRKYKERKLRNDPTGSSYYYTY